MTVVATLFSTVNVNKWQKWPGLLQISICLGFFVALGKS